MYRLQWDRDTERLFGYGVSRGVLYVKKDVLDLESITDYEYGVVWNGLTSVKLGGNDPFGYLNADNLKWNRFNGNEYLTGTIEAVNYPEEFMSCDGKMNASRGVYVSQQTGKAFGMCYRTELGDEHDQEAGYLIHIIYDMAVRPTDVIYTTIGDTIESDSYSWDFEALPVEVEGYKPFSEIVIDSRNVPKDRLETIEKVLYGYGDSMPYLPGFLRLLNILEYNEYTPLPYIFPIKNKYVLDELFNNTIMLCDDPYGISAMCIPFEAFNNCLLLSYAIFPACSYIGYSAFAYCSSLTSVSFPVCSHIESCAFAYCYNLSSIYFPFESIESIYYCTFMYCSSLTSVSFPVCSYIGYSAFEYCSSLSSVSFPVCSYIGYSAFAYCSSLSSVSFPVCSYIGSSAFTHCRSLSSVSFPMCSYIGSYAFAHCYNLSSIYFPFESIISIYGGTFMYCSSLTLVSFPVCSYIGYSAFAYCSSLSSVSFPVCSYIGSSAFEYCSSLSSVSFPVCSYIGSRAFYSCISLSSVSFPVCSYIGSSAFTHCRSLSSVSFPMCSYIGSYAFAYCRSLSSVSFPVCSYIGSSAFKNCSSLSAAYLGYNSVVGLGYDALGVTPMENSSYLGYYGSIYVPASLVSSYKSAPNWSYYSDRITSIPE